MKNKKISTRAIFAMLVSLWIFVSGCEKETLTQFESKPAVNFDLRTVTSGGTGTYSTDYSFLINPDEEYVQEIAVSIMGVAADRERHFNVEVVDDEVTTATPGQYEILGGTVAAGAYKGTLAVKLKKTPDLQENTVYLKVRIVDSEDFKVGNKESVQYVLSWTNRATPPPINVYVRTFFIANWSTQAYRIFTQTTGMLNFLVADYSRMGEAGTIALSTKFGDYIKQWNLDHPNDKLVHDDGPLVGQPIDPKYYTKSKYN